MRCIVSLYIRISSVHSQLIRMSDTYAHMIGDLFVTLLSNLKMNSHILYSSFFAFVGRINSMCTSKHKELNGGAIAFSVHFHGALCANQVQLRVFCSSWLANIVIINALSSHVHFTFIPYKLIELNLFRWSWSNSCIYTYMCIIFSRAHALPLSTTHSSL